MNPVEVFFVRVDPPALVIRKFERDRYQVITIPLDQAGEVIKKMQSGVRELTQQPQGEE